ncbi:hypothetical protein ABG067_006697 [Albugo candida]
MSPQKLAVKVLKLQGIGSDGTKALHLAVRLHLCGSTQTTKVSTTHEYNEQFHFELRGKNKEDTMRVEVLRGKKTIGSKALKLDDLLQLIPNMMEVKVELVDLSTTAVITMEIGDDCPTPQDNSEAEVVQTSQVSREKPEDKEPKESPCTSMISQPTPRPWFMRLTYYYDATKRLYNYSTSFPVVNSVARFGESTTDMVLKRISGKTLMDLDKEGLMPLLSLLDDSVDQVLATALLTVAQSQSYIVHKKDVVAETISHVAHKSVSTITDTAENAIQIVCKAKNYTTTQIINVSSSVYTGVYGTTLSIVSHVPYLGAKLRT